MKTSFICILGMVVAVLAGGAAAQENDQRAPFHGGVAYIKYHLLQDARPFEKLDLMHTQTEPPRLTFKNGKIDEIDAYFEPEVSNFTIGKIDNWQDWPLDGINPVKADWSAESAATGALWLKIAHNSIHQGPSENYLLRDEQHLLRGKLNLPLGESSFSLGAYLALYTANILAESPKAGRTSQSQWLEPSAVVSNLAQAGFASNSGSQGETWPSQIPVAAGMTNRNAVVGAVNFSGDLNRVNVFTEVGFASGNSGLTEDAAAAAYATDFYALGGAKYKVGQVTLGVEAGFENGNDPIEAVKGNFPGFENDFWSDRVIEDGMPNDQSNNKLYAKVSAQMNPVQKINVEGALSYIKPMESVNGTNIYGVQVNGALYYSLTKYVKYLIKAGVTSLMQNASLEGRQYKLMNRVEVKF